MASLAQTRIQREACLTKTKLSILLRLNMAADRADKAKVYRVYFGREQRSLKKAKHTSAREPELHSTKRRRTRVRGRQF